MEFLKLPKATKAAMSNSMIVTSTLNNVSVTAYICSGSMPADPSVFDTATNSPSGMATAITAQGGTILVTCPTSTTAATASSTTGNLVIGDSPLGTAAASGQATWFMLQFYDGSTVRGYIMGSVSDLNGSGDIRITNTTIVAGQQYRTGLFELALPTEMVF